MFDLSAGTIDRPFRDPHASATVLSVATHIAVLGSIAWVVLFSVSDTLPHVPTIVAFVAEAPVPSPPPPPPPAAKAAKAAQISKPVPTTGPTFTVPTEIPVGIQPESGIDLSDEGGEVGGVEGGIPGGVLGGILGGMINEAPPPPPPAPAKPKRVGGELRAPALVHRVEPDYPGVAVAGKVSGTVILEATVNESGAVTDVTILRSIKVLDQAAIKAVKQWRYEPLVLNGQPVPFILVVTVTFSLR
jgi:periplasmic protein TonB